MQEKNSRIREISLRFSKREWEFSFKDQNAGGTEQKRERGSSLENLRVKYNNWNTRRREKWIIIFEERRKSSRLHKGLSKT